MSQVAVWRRVAIMLGLMAGLAAAPVWAAEPAKTPEQLAQESVEKCSATAAEKATPKLIVQKVKEACEVLEKEGSAAFPKFRGKDSPFIFGGTYILILDRVHGNMAVHPIQWKLEGRDMMKMRDANGKAINAEGFALADKGGGWQEYVWPKPGEKQPSPKVSYVKLAKHGEEAFVIMCGSWDITMDQATAESDK